MLLVTILLSSLVSLVLGQSCTFSCPLVNVVGEPIVERPYAIGAASYHNVFECIYSLSEPDAVDHKCTYHKDTGVAVLGHVDDNCPTNAVPCLPADDSLTNPTPIQHRFSTPSKTEVPPWVETGRFLVSLKINPPRN